MTRPSSNHNSNVPAGGIAPDGSTEPVEVFSEGLNYYGWIICGTLMVLVMVVILGLLLWVFDRIVYNAIYDWILGVA